MSTPFHTESFEGFDIAVYALPEDDDPSGYFASGDDEWDREQCQAIYDGNVEWFCAKVTASKAGIELASDYLGACAYKRLADFIDVDCYYGDMRANVAAMARNNIAKLSDA